MRGALSDFMPRDRDIISRRMGLNGPQRTLAEIGLSYDISRERIRQIEAKIVAQFFERGLWHKRLLNKLAKLLEGREFPLPLLGIEAADSWYAGIDQIPDAIQYILEHSPNNDIETVKIDHLVFIGNINQERWEDSVSEARRLIASGLQDNWSEEHCKTVVSALIPQSACEFRELLWDKAATEAHFSANELGFKVLTSFGRGVEHIVQAVLQDAERPLHFTEIAIRASERAKREIDARRAHNAAGAVGILLGRGTYGATKHLPLPPEEMEALAYEAEDVISAGPTDRQWHAEELLEALIESGSQLARSVDKYVLNAALERSKNFQCLGRLVWAQRRSLGGGN